MEKYTHKNIHKITKTGRGSYYVIVPKQFMRDLEWKEHQKVVIKKVGKRLIIEDWVPNKGITD